MEIGIVYRAAIEQLHKWKENPNKKPLIVRGARQVGKTWLLKEFAGSYEDSVYISFDNNQKMKNLFSEDFDVKRIVLGLELYAGRKIEPASTLIIFDEVQEAPKALTSLKYFNESAPEYHIACAGSMLGVALHSGTSFPVGKVEFMDLFPLSFSEFLTAMGNERYAELIKRGDFDMMTAFKQVYINMLKYYYFVGGMPEAVLSFSENEDFNKVREIQERILAAYEQDFSKHAPNDAVPRIRMLYNGVPAQLSKENRKFIYGLLKEGARAKEYELAMLWLYDCGLIHKIHRAGVPNLPLKAYEDLKAFKLFLSDVGLLSCMTGLRQDVLLDGNTLFKEFKGALTEQYVLQQLKTLKGVHTFYWSSERGGAEIDFLIEYDKYVIPVEVKAETNLQAKSLRTYREKYKPDISIRASMADYKKEEGLINLPLYAIGEVASCIKNA